MKTIEAILSMVKAICGTKRYDYLSGPITGGLRVVEAYDQAKADPSRRDGTGWFEQAKAANIVALQERAEELRAETNTVLIEPASFEANIDKWGQPEFLALWERVIADHAKHVRFVEGWQYSSGCIFEYRCALHNGHDTVDERGGAIAYGQALRLLDDALADLTARLPTDAGDDDRLGKLIRRIGEERDMLAKQTARVGRGR